MGDATTPGVFLQCFLSAVQGAVHAGKLRHGPCILKSSSSAAGISSPAVPCSPRAEFWRSWHAVLLSFPLARGMQSTFCLSKFSAFVTASSSKIRRFGRAIIPVTSSVSAA